MEAPRNLEQRKSDTLTRLGPDVDAWIATADTAGSGYLVPLSFFWDGAGLAWDPREGANDYAYFRIVPDRVQAWREVNELPGRTLMRDGAWLG